MKQQLIKIYLRDNGICWICGGSVSEKDATVDHILPRSKDIVVAGIHLTPKPELGLRLAHRYCNNVRGNEEGNLEKFNRIKYGTYYEPISAKRLRRIEAERAILLESLPSLIEAKPIVKKEEVILTELNIDNLNKLIEEKYISVQKHPVLDLYIYNYTHKTQYDQNWNNETLQCRGLILDKDYNVVARPFPKFFNLSEAEGKGIQIPAEDFIVTEKMDGSLGILYRDVDGYSLATRGSFVSDQAHKGTQLLREKYGFWRFEDISDPVTILFEIIYPDNRIVVDYGNQEDLVLLTVIDNETGEEWPYDLLVDLGLSFNIPVVPKYDGITDFSKIEQRPNSEGYVIHFPSSGQRFKIKFDEYVRLHRIITNVNKKAIWEILSNNQSMDEIIDKVPDEFYQWVQNTIKELNDQYYQIDGIAQKEFGQILDKVEAFYPSPEYRKEFASYAMKSTYPPIMFNLLDGKPYDQIIWKLIKPTADKPFKVDIDS